MLAQKPRQKQVVLTLVLYRFGHLIGECNEIILIYSFLVYVRNLFGKLDVQKLEELWLLKGSQQKAFIETKFLVLLTRRCTWI